MKLQIRLRVRHAAVISSALLTLLLGPASLPAQPLHVTLPENARGAAAIAALGQHLPEVARAYDITPQRLATLFQIHPSLAVDIHGNLHYLCEGLALTAEEAQAFEGSTVAPGDSIGESVPLTATSSTTDVFKLHSQPGSPLVIYLDFDGHTTSGTSWNTSYAGGKPITSEPFSLDGDNTTFNDSERTFIRNVWRRVSEDYAPFSVNVTTEDPGIEGLRRTANNDAAHGIRVVISPTNWYGSAGGVGYIGSFRASTDTPVFVFTGNLANSEKPVAECTSHEVGHSLGLYHDGLGGSTPTEYYRGQGNWAPIMGNSYYNEVTQFSRGEYANANNTQDDLTVVQGYVALMIDDHGNTLDTATPLAGPNVADGGTIHTRTDVDVFRFSTGAGTISLNIASPSPQPNLDLTAELLNASGQVLQTSDSATALNASIAAMVPGGTYYLRVTGVGNADPITTGYSDYASLGDYVITGTLIATSGMQAPAAVVTVSATSGVAPLTVAFSAAASSDPDGTIVSYRWDFGTGVSSTAANPTYIYQTAGTFTARLTVTDNDGLTGSASVTVQVNAAPNQLPVAVASGGPLTGTAPLPVTFSSAGSYDPDGSIVAYAWNFGDGTSSSAASPTKTYSSAGTYTARVTVTDNRGGTSSATVTVSVTEVSVSKIADNSLDVDVYSLTVGTSATAPNGRSALSTIIVRNRSGQLVAGAAIAVQWSGLVTGNTSGVTNASGEVVLSSNRTKKKGTITATIKSVTPPTGVAYDAAIFAEPLVRSIAF